MITVYSTGPGCHKCLTTKLHLKKRGAPFEEVRVDQDEDEAELLRELGFNSAPVVHAGSYVFEGYHPDLLDKISELAIAGPESTAGGLS